MLDAGDGFRFGLSFESQNVYIAAVLAAYLD
jgi:hypothetical protein